MNSWLSLAGAGLALAAGIPELAAQEPVRIDTGVAVPMRDGVVLRADLYRPPGAGKFPVLVYRTPYGRSDTAGAPPFASAAAARGYAVLLEDVRGRYGSDGTFVAYQQEGKDGYD